MHWAGICKITNFYLKNPFLVVKFSIYLNRRVFVMHISHSESSQKCGIFFIFFFISTFIRWSVKWLANSIKKSITMISPTARHDLNLIVLTRPLNSKAIEKERHQQQKTKTNKKSKRCIMKIRATKHAWKAYSKTLHSIRGLQDYL